MNENPTYEHDIDTKWKENTPKSTQEIMIRSTMKKTLKHGLILEDNSRHAVDKIHR